MIMVKKREISRQVLGFIALAALILFAVSASVAHRHVLMSWETSLLMGIYGWPDSLRPVFLALTQLGSAWMLIILPLAAWANQQYGLALRLLLNGTTAFVLVEIAKNLVGRQRPAFLVPGLLQRESFTTGLGFPSGHTAIATVMSLTLLPYLFPKHRWVVAVWIVLVALSRIYLGVHAPLDILGGFSIGVVAACLSYMYKPWRKYAKAA
jgi:membrane-associated phospholipid phosphatase